MNVTVNGEPPNWPMGITLRRPGRASGCRRTGVAAAVDGEVAPRGTWSAVVLRDGQAIELLTAVQGG